MDATDWTRHGDFEDIAYETADGLAKLTICRPEVRNAFRPQTLFELSRAFDAARDDPRVGVIILTGEGPDAFCSGGDQRVRGDDGYLGDDEMASRGIGRLNVLDLQIQIRRLPDRMKPRTLSAPEATSGYEVTTAISATTRWRAAASAG